MGRHRPRSHSEIQMRDIHFHAQLTQTSLLTKHRPRINRTPVMKYGDKMLLSLMLTWILTACDNKAYLDKEGKLSPRQIIKMEKDFFYSLHPGMTKEEVQKITGRPHNSDNEFVWCFSTVDDYPHDFKWMKFLGSSYGVFFVFDESGKLATNFYKNTEADPWEALATAYNSMQNDPRIIKLLGPPPKLLVPRQNIGRQ